MIYKYKSWVLSAFSPLLLLKLYIWGRRGANGEEQKQKSRKQEKERRDQNEKTEKYMFGWFFTPPLMFLSDFSSVKVKTPSTH